MPGWGDADYHSDWKSENPCNCGTRHLRSTSVQWRTCRFLDPVTSAVPGSVLAATASTVAFAICPPAGIVALGAMLVTTLVKGSQKKTTLVLDAVTQEYIQVHVG
jgi:hypothetical protein